MTLEERYLSQHKVPCTAPAHHWVIGNSSAGYALGVCKHCSVERAFDTNPDYTNTSAWQRANKALYEREIGGMREE
jgi:hypothetical protein